MSYRALKRAVDVVGALLGLALGALPVLLAAAAVRLVMGPPAFFRQVRPGLGGRPFTLLKLRTMLPPAVGGEGLPPAVGREGLPPAAGGGGGDAERLTPLGRFLRRTSLDELPGLVNVLRGEMSLVGPRPLLVEYLDRYSPRQARRHEVKPGLTGWAQVHGRNAISWEERLDLDVWYVEHASLLLDVKILGLTLLKVVTLEGIAAPGHATMPEFRGSREPAAAAAASPPREER